MRNTFTHIIMTFPLSIHPFSTLLIFCRVAGGWGLSPRLGPPFTLYYSSFRNIQYRLISHFIKTTTGEVNNIGYIFTMAPVKWWNLLGSKWTVSSWNELEAGKINERNDLSDFDEDQIVIKASQKGKSCGMFLWAWSDKTCFFMLWPMFCWNITWICTTYLKDCCRPHTPLHGSGVPWWQWHSATLQQLFNHDRVQGVAFASKFPRSQYDWVSMGCAGPTNLIQGGPPCKLQDLKDLLLMSWCQIQQDRFRGLMELFWQHMGGLHDISQVVLLLWMFSVFIKHPIWDL